MQMNRRSFLETLAGAAAVTGAGAAFGAGAPSGKLGRPAVQLYSIREYIAGKKDGSLKGVGPLVHFGGNINWRSHVGNSGGFSTPRAELAGDPAAHSRADTQTAEPRTEERHAP